MDTHAQAEKLTGNVVAGNFSRRQPQDRGCADCAARNLCLPGVAPRQAPQDLQPWVDHWRSMAAGKYLFRQGDRFSGVFFVRSGAVKTFRTLVPGDEQVNGFHLPGDLFGFEGWQPGCQPTSAVTLETTSVCYLPVKRLHSAASEPQQLQCNLLAKVSEMCNRQQELSAVLSRNKAVERIAAFLLDLSRRYATRHLSASSFRLPMSRTDISHYLGLSLECVSRAFAQLEKAGLLACSGRCVEILDINALRQLVGVAVTSRQALPL